MERFLFPTRNHRQPERTRNESSYKITSIKRGRQLRDPPWLLYEDLREML